jgi:hypothetical protein
MLAQMVITGSAGSQRTGHGESGISVGFAMRVILSSHVSPFWHCSADGCLNPRFGDANNRYFPDLTIPRSK